MLTRLLARTRPTLPPSQDEVNAALRQAGFNLDPPAVAALIDVRCVEKDASGTPARPFARAGTPRPGLGLSNQSAFSCILNYPVFCSPTPWTHSTWHQDS